MLKLYPRSNSAILSMDKGVVLVRNRYDRHMQVSDYHRSRGKNSTMEVWNINVEEDHPILKFPIMNNFCV